MTDTESLVIEMAAGLKLVTGMLGLTVALLPAADRALVLDALAALQTEGGPQDGTAHQGKTAPPDLAARSSSEAARALALLVEKFAGEISSARDGAVGA